jgi:hypothetical protein
LHARADPRLLTLQREFGESDQGSVYRLLPVRPLAPVFVVAKEGCLFGELQNALKPLDQENGDACGFEIGTGELQIDLLQPVHLGELIPERSDQERGH